MNHRLSTNRAIFLLLACIWTFLPACASTQAAKQKLKVGLHIDAVLEFVVEYPLAWKKQRRMSYGSNTGEVRWTNPDQPNTLLKVGSSLHAQQTVSLEQQIDQALQEYAGLEVALQEKVTLPAAESWHIRARSAELNLDLYLLANEDRNYSITLATPADQLNNYEEFLKSIAQNFQIMPR